jgi:hypothetical protein
MRTRSTDLKIGLDSRKLRIFIGSQVPQRGMVTFAP